ncbi:MAG: tyrosine-type recombinase/integrase [Acidobacteriia bacterium]|nr:tyrosine-type recombinase/integrase [Terriglobia bacterium]
MTNSEPKFLTEEEIERLFGAIGDPRNLAIMRVAYHRGLRASEVGLLQLADYRPAAKRLLVHRLKGSHSGEYLLTDHETRALNAWVKIRGAEPGPLFPSNRGTGIDRRMLDVLMKRYGAAAEIPDAKRHMHCLKHSCGTHLLSGTRSLAPLDVAEVQDHLGHADIRNTMVYSQITNRRRDEIARRIKAW